MTHGLLRSILLALAVFASMGAIGRGDEELASQVQSAEQEIAQLKASELQAQAAVVESRTQVQTLEQRLRRHERQRDAAVQSLDELAKHKPEKEAAAVKAQLARTAAAAQVAQAELMVSGLKDQAEATTEQKQQADAKLAEAKQQLAAAEGALAQPTAELLQALEAAAVQMQQRDEAAAEVQRLTAECDAARTALSERNAAAEAAGRARLERERSLQTLLVEAGRWVSFTDEVAPILQQRCAACHNARSAKGRLNLESYATLSQGGESGPTFVPGNTTESLLCTVTADGSMPQDADPLTPEQQQTLARWVEYGGRLDAGVDATARLVQVVPRRPQPSPPEHYPSPVAITAVAWSPDGQRLATSGYHEVLIWNAADGALVRRIPNVAESIYDLSFHPDGQRLAVAAGTPASTGELKVFRLADGELLADLVRMEDVLLGAAYSPDGSRLAACGSDRSVRVFDASSHAPLVTIEDHADWVHAVAWSADGARLATASRDKTSKVFQAESGDAVGTFNGHGETVYGVAFTADGKQVVTCGADKLARVWNIEDAKEVRKLDGATGDVLSLVLLPDGRVVSGGSDQRVRVQQISDGKTTVTLTEHPDWVYAVDLCAAVNQIATGCADGKIRLWNAETGELLREWVAAP